MCASFIMIQNSFFPQSFNRLAARATIDETIAAANIHVTAIKPILIYFLVSELTGIPGSAMGILELLVCGGGTDEVVGRFMVMLTG